MTNPFLLLGIANLLEIILAVVSAVLINKYLLNAARPLKSKKWLIGSPSAVLVLAVGLLWFRLYGPLVDIAIMGSGNMLPGYTFFIVQALAWLIFAPFMFTAYLMILERLQAKPAAAASLRLLKANFRSAWPLFTIALALFLAQTALLRLAPALTPVWALGLGLLSTVLRVGFGFWLLTAWLLWAEAKYRPKII
jgi:hypothetical protein